MTPYARALTLLLALAACSPSPIDMVDARDAGTNARTDAGPRRDGGTAMPVDGGTPISTTDGGTPCTPGMVPGMWARTTSGTDADFVGLFGAQPDALFALADTTVRRGNGSAWAAGPMFEFERMSGMNVMTLRLTAIGGFDASSTFAAGIVGTNGGGEAPRGEMYRVNGNAVTSVPLPAMGLQIVSIRGSAADNVWGVGGGRAIQWDGARWVDRSNGIPTGTELYDVWAFAPNDVWAVGTRVLRWDGTTWRDTALAFSGAYFGVWGSSPSNVWIVGNTVTRRWDGAAFRDALTGTTADLRAVWGSGPGDVWAAGEEGALAHFDGATWTAVASGVNTRLSRLWGFAANDVWAVGERGVALHYTFTGSGTPMGMPCTPTNPMGLGDGMGTRVSAVNQSVCARRADGSLRCWGNNNDRQLGDGTTMTRNTPTVVTALTEVSDVALSSFHGCAAKADGSVWCWASGRSGQLGNGMDLITSATPVRANGITEASAVAVGGSHSCALLRTGAALCWGANMNGQVGDGTNAQRAFPVPIAGATDLVQLVAGLNHTCARRSNGAVLCWGAGSLGQLGDGGMRDSNRGVMVGGLSDAVFLGAGSNHTCAVRATGAVVCWGANAGGQLGDGTTMNRPTPVPVSGVSDAAAVGGGLSHTCAVRRGGGLRCWGANLRGQLGDGTTTDRPAPVDVPTITDAARVTGRIGFHLRDPCVGGAALLGWQQQRTARSRDDVGERAGARAPHRVVRSAPRASSARPSSHSPARRIDARRGWSPHRAPRRAPPLPLDLPHPDSHSRSRSRPAPRRHGARSWKTPVV
ncbi:MAG: hypothetical protein U0325_25615 [Polyangiales bacterium]